VASETSRGSASGHPSCLRHQGRRGEWAEPSCSIPHLQLRFRERPTVHAGHGGGSNLGHWPLPPPRRAPPPLSRGGMGQQISLGFVVCCCFQDPQAQRLTYAQGSILIGDKPSRQSGVICSQSERRDARCMSGRPHGQLKNRAAELVSGSGLPTLARWAERYRQRLRA